MIDGGINFGVGLEFKDGPRSVALDWERFDYRDETLSPNPKHYYDVLGIKGYYNFDKGFALPRLKLPMASLSDARKRSSLYVSILSGSESAALTETSTLANQHLALTGYQGLVGLGYDYVIKPEFSLAFDVSLGSSSAIYHADRFQTSLLQHRLGGNASKQLAYYAALAPTWQAHPQAGILAKLGVVRADWTLDLPYGVVASNTSSMNGISPLEQTADTMSVNGLMFGVAEKLGITPELSILFEYDYTRFSGKEYDAQVEADRVNALQLAEYQGTKFRYKPSSDRF